MTKREFVMLAQTFDPVKHDCATWMLSEKIDGMRFLWLPWTRGKSVDTIPFANLDRSGWGRIASGLWSRYGNVVHAPDSILDTLPDYPLDGELYCGRGRFQETISCVRKLEPNIAEWSHIQFRIFDLPTLDSVFEPGRINCPNYSMIIDPGFRSWYRGSDSPLKSVNGFEARYHKMCRMSELHSGQIEVQGQSLLPHRGWQEIVEEELFSVTTNGGEGLMLRQAMSPWKPIRNKYLLKVKKMNDMEGTVVGFRSGLGKHQGRLGSLQLVLESGVRLDIGGFTDIERELYPEYEINACASPGYVFTTQASKHFLLGSRVTFLYRELTLDGVPKEARYHRRRNDF